MDHALLFEESQRSLREAREAVAARESFLSVASHELRTPLNTLQLQVQSFTRHAERAADSTLALPISAELTPSQQEAVVGALADALGR